ncbi:MAG: S1C family serine protease [Clostridiaceae bacterium]
MIKSDMDQEESSREEISPDVIKVNKKRRRLIKVVALLTVIIFLIFSLPDLSSFITVKTGFLNENGILLKDKIVKQCRPAVVNVMVDIKGGAERQGTGFNISPQGVIVTNEHVVDQAELITVEFADGRKYYSGNYEEIKGYDLAIIRIKGDSLPSLVLNIDNEARTGDTVTIIGNPLGFERIAQRGLVGQYFNSGENASPVFDIGVEVNPGNSGSPVINSEGQVVGVIFAASGKRALAIGASHIIY